MVQWRLKSRAVITLVSIVNNYSLVKEFLVTWMKSETTGGYSSWILQAMNIAVIPRSWKSIIGVSTWQRYRSMKLTVACIVSGSNLNSTWTTMSQLMRI